MMDVEQHRKDSWSQDELLEQILRAVGGGEAARGSAESATGDQGTNHASEREIPQAKMEAKLLERARALAKSSDVGTSEGMPLVVFSLAKETYGIPTDYVRDVQPLRHVTPVPCTPGFVVGVINIRGSIYSVIDIRSFFGVAAREITNATKVIVVDTDELQVGIMADDVSGAMSVPRDQINPPLAAQATIKEEYIEGVTNDMLIILNLEALMQDERIVIHEEVG